MRALAYVRVSTREQGESGAGLAAERKAIANELDRRVWDLVDVVEEVVSTRKQQPGLRAAIDRVKAGEADVLIASKLDRLCRSTFEFCELLEDALKNEWQLVICNMAAADLTTPEGRFFARNLANFAEFERDMISIRIKEALAVKKAAGVRLGRERVMDPDIVRVILRMRDSGRSYQKIADYLNREGLLPVSAPEWKWENVRDRYKAYSMSTIPLAD